MTFTLLAYIGAVYLLAGCVKGVVGLGLPTISLALLAAVLGLKEAMVILLVPSFITNIVQAFSGGQLNVLLRRFWPFLILLCIFTWFSTGVLVIADGDLLATGLGVVLIVYCGVSLTNFRIPSPGKWERWLTPIMGAFTGISTGLTGTFVVPGILYLQSMNLGKDGLVQAMGLCFTIATLALGFSLGGRGVLGTEETIVSCAMVVPALLGMYLGVRIRKLIDEQLFRKLFFIALLAVGVWIILSAVLVGSPV